MDIIINDTFYLYVIKLFIKVSVQLYFYLPLININTKIIIYLLVKSNLFVTVE